MMGAEVSIMMKKETGRELGRRGEEAAALFLQGLGQRIIERNWRCRSGEVDLITEDGDTLVFCEVKTRRSVSAGEPSEAITPGKQRRYSRLAEIWLSRHDQYDGVVRFDVISILVTSKDRAQITLIKDAFMCEEGS